MAPWVSPRCSRKQARVVQRVGRVLSFGIAIGEGLVELAAWSHSAACS